MENCWIVIGIGGATCSGKTTIANELHSKLPESIVIHQDDYYYPVGSPNLEYIEELKHTNWDTLSAINVDRMVEDIEKILSDTTNDNVRVLIIEGTLVLNELRVRARCVLKYYLVLPYEISKERRYEKMYEYPDPPMNFDLVVWPHYLRYKSQLEGDDISFIDTHEHNVTTILNIILRELSQFCLSLKN